MSQYALMHKNDVCGSLIIDDETGTLKIYKDNGSGLSPFLGNADTRRMKHWWEGRAVPASRKMMQEVLKQAGCTNTKMYLAKNLALSMTDSYWIRPLDMDVKYEDVKLSSMNPFSDNKVPYHNATSYDSNAALGGQMEKYWDIETQFPTLVKESYKYFGQQAINEAFATYLHDLQETTIPYVPYLAGHTEDNGLYCRCDAFTNDSVELVSAYEVIEGSKLQNDKSLYDNYIRICAKFGIEAQEISDFMDYQTLTDFIISNTDEHLGNFGILRDSNTMQYLGPAPIYDSGNSMFFKESSTVHTRLSLLQQPITSFYDSEEKMVKNIKNRQLVNIDLLPTVEETIALYTSYGFPEERAITIANNYALKVDMTYEFENGATISMYHERQKESENIPETNNLEDNTDDFDVGEDL